MTPAPLLLADDLFSRVLPWVVVLLGATIVGAVVISLVRRSMRPDEASGGGGFTLHDLREMHARGALSDDEFERARAAMIEKVRGAPAADGADGDDPSAPADAGAARNAGGADEHGAGPAPDDGADDVTDAGRSA